MTPHHEMQNPLPSTDTPLVDAFFLDAVERYKSYREWTNENRYFALLGLRDLLGKAHDLERELSAANARAEKAEAQLEAEVALTAEQTIIAKFYGVGTKDEIIAAQDKHIERLQERILPRDVRVRTQVREG